MQLSQGGGEESQKEVFIPIKLRQVAACGGDWMKETLSRQAECWRTATSSAPGSDD